MMSLIAVKSVDYYDHLRINEYHTGSGEPAGNWCNGLEQLGIESGADVASEALNKIMLGYALNGEKITQSAGKETHRIGHDLTFSAPKSVSLIWVNADADLQAKISTAQALAVDKAMAYLKDKTQARTGKQGVNLTPVKNFIYAKFEHCDSREKDPQLHTHTLLSSTCIREDGKTGTYENKGLMTYQKHAGTLYLAELASALKALGFKVEQDTNIKNAVMFKVAGVGEEIAKHFSKRREQIKEVAAEIGATSATAMQKIALSTRSKKTDIDRAVQFENWRNESAALGFNSASIEALKGVSAKPFEKLDNAALLEKLTENESVFKREDLELALIELSQFENVDIEKEMADFLAQKECVHLVAKGKNAEGKDYVLSRFTSQKMIDLEAAAVASAKLREEETKHILPAALVQKVIAQAEEKNGFQFRAEQREAIEKLTLAKGGVVIFKGKAGAGKTTSLTPAIAAYKASGYQVLGATISAKAGLVLEQETGLKTATIAQTLIDLDKQKLTLTAKTLLVIDEVGLLGSREFSRLQRYCDASGAKMILAGDEKQLQAVAAGGILNALQKHGFLKAAELTEITRQKDEQQRTASALFSEGKAAEALEIYEKMGQIKSEKFRGQVVETLARDYANDTNKPSEKMAIVATNADRELLNTAIRAQLQKIGKIGKDIAKFENAAGLEMQLAVGDRLIFKQNDKKNNIQNNLTATVQAVVQKGKNCVIEAVDDNGKKHSINTKDYPQLLHAYALTTHASQGSTVKNSYVLFNRGASDASLGYVGMTRHKNHAALYTSATDKDLLALKFSQQNLKGTTLDFEIQEKPQATPAVALPKIERPEAFDQPLPNWAVRRMDKLNLAGNANEKIKDPEQEKNKEGFMPFNPQAWQGATPKANFGTIMAGIFASGNAEVDAAYAAKIDKFMATLEALKNNTIISPQAPTVKPPQVEIER